MLTIIRAIRPLLPMFALIGCETFGNKKPESSWSVLRLANPVKCNLWPKQDSDISNRNLTFLKGGEKNQFLITATSRNNRRVDYFVEAPSGRVPDPESFQKVPLPADVQIINPLTLDGQSLVALIAPVDDKSMEFQVRRFPENIVTHKFKVNHPAIVDAKAISTKDYLWLLAESGDEFELLALQKSAGKESPRKLMQTDDDLQMVPGVGDNEVLVVKLRTDGKNKVFEIYRVHANAKRPKREDLSIKLETNLESWNVLKIDQRYFLTFVAGDSLSGQAEFNALSFELTPSSTKELYRKSFKLNDAHVSDPLLIPGKESALTLIMQWLDNESSLSLFKLQDDGVTPAEFYGVFPQGAGVIDSYRESSDGGVYVVIRKSESLSAEFYSCHLKANL